MVLCSRRLRRGRRLSNVWRRWGTALSVWMLRPPEISWPKPGAARRGLTTAAFPGADITTFIPSLSRPVPKAGSTRSWTHAFSFHARDLRDRNRVRRPRAAAAGRVVLRAGRRPHRDAPPDGSGHPGPLKTSCATLCRSLVVERDPAGQDPRQTRPPRSGPRVSPLQPRERGRTAQSVAIWCCLHTCPDRQAAKSLTTHPPKSWPGARSPLSTAAVGKTGAWPACASQRCRR